MKESNMLKPPGQALQRLANEHPDWLPVVEAAAAVAARVEGQGGEFPGAWVVDELGRRGFRRWIPNLRILVSYGLLEKSGPSSRGGRRAYYRMPDRLAIEERLVALRAHPGAEKPRKLRFVASGASTGPPADVARRAGEIVYEPRSWR